MTTMLMFAAALVPAILLFIYMWHKDAKKEPANQLLCAVLLGVVVCIPVSFVESGIQYVLFGDMELQAVSLVDCAVDAFFVAAIPEEAFKLIVLWLFLRRNQFFDEHYDGIVYAVCVGLGFAGFENIFYIFDNMEDWQTVAIARALLSVPGHYAFGVLMGYYYSRYHFGGKHTSDAIKTFAMPVLAHGIYDTIAFSQELDTFEGSISFVVLIVFCIWMHRAAQRRIKEQVARDKDFDDQRNNMPPNNWTFPQA